MYSSGYSQVSKYNPEARKKMQHRSKSKGCGYYMRVVFFFSSLIQSLIIVSLVLFLVYGKKQDSASMSRIEDLEESFSRLSIENVALRQQRKNLTVLLNVTLTEKARNDWDLAQLRYAANISYFVITDLSGRLNQCLLDKNRNPFSLPLSPGGPPCKPPVQIFAENCNCGLQAEQLKAMIQLVRSNFTQTTQMMRMEMDQIYRERDNINLEAIRLRREKSTLEKEMAAYRVKCREDFAQSLSGISDVSKAFLEKIDSLFPRHIAFQLTCDKQRENLEQIRSNCTSLSREVEDRFQRYLDSVGAQVSQIQSESSRLKAENWRLTEDYRWCSQNRTGLIQQHKQTVQIIQLKHDDDKEKLLKEKKKLDGEKDVMSHNLNVKDKEITHLKDQIKLLNMTCGSRTGSALFPGRSTFGTNTVGQASSQWNKINLGGSSPSISSSSSGASLNPYSRTTSTGSNPSLSSTNLGLNKPGTGTSSSGSTGSSSSTNVLGSSRPGSNTVGSSSSGSNRLGSASTSGVGSSSSSGSVLTGTGTVKKPGSTGLGLGLGLGLGTGTSNTGQSSSVVKTGSSSTGFGSWLGLGTGSSSSNTGSKPGIGLGKATTGSSTGGVGSTFGAGRTSGTGAGSTSGSVNINQHLQDLQRIANPSSTQDKNKKDTSGRVVG